MVRLSRLSILSVAMWLGLSASVVSAAEPTAVVPNGWPTSTVAKYKGDVKAKGMTFSGKGEWAWYNKNTAYNTTLKLKAFFKTLRSQRSQGTLEGKQLLQPVSFVDEKSDTDTTVFDYVEKKITFNNKKQQDVTPNVLDRLNVLVKLGADIQHKAPAVGATYNYAVAGNNKLQNWTFTVDSLHTLTLDLNDKEQQVQAYRVLKQEKDKKIVGFWYAPSVHVLPVRIELRKPNGEQGEFNMVELEAL